MPPTSVSHPDLTAITVFLASTATPEGGGLPYLDAVLPAEHRLAATRVVRDVGALPPDAILYLLAQPLLDLASDQLMRDRDLTTRYAERFEVEGTDDLMPGVVSLPHGWGHDVEDTRLSVAKAHPGVNANALTDDRAYDEASGTAVLFGTPVTVEAATQSTSRAAACSVPSR